VILAFLLKRGDLLQKLFCRHFDQIPQVAVPQRPLHIDYVTTFFVIRQLRPHLPYVDTVR